MRFVLAAQDAHGRSTMRNRLIPVLGMLTLAATGASAAVSTYVAGYGDTLWDISNRFYGTHEYWDDILAANPSLASPEALQPGMELVLPEIAGAVVQASGDVYTTTYVQAPTLAASTPMLSRLRLETAGFIAVDPLQPDGVVLGVNVEEAEGIANDDAYAGDLVEVDLGSADGVVNGTVFTILSEGQTAIDPESGGELGPIIRIAGVCRVVGVTESTSVTLLEHSYRAVHAGDPIVYYRPAGNVAVNSVPVLDEISVWVVAFQDDDFPDAYTFDVVYLNRGSDAGLAAGDAFEAYRYGPVAEGLDGQMVEMADIPVAEVVILSVQRTTCSAIVSVNRTGDLIQTGDRLHLARRQARDLAR